MGTHLSNEADRHIPDYRSPLATPGELADYTGGSVQTLAVWRMKGIGPKFIKMGRHVRYRWADIEAWLDAQTEGGAA